MNDSKTNRPDTCEDGSVCKLNLRNTEESCEKEDKINENVIICDSKLKSKLKGTNRIIRPPIPKNMNFSINIKESSMIESVEDTNENTEKVVNCSTRNENLNLKDLTTNDYKLKMSDKIDFFR